ncbi:hypothetical protein F5144DRAFT_173817 [Chaetomium tenue]|uniref:Uncharacterized protein n=1 Tax=Chaetomium tenue TaxID=1854479 RepID=A0ACB7PF50_9PEZI|nr:hypothetical protein F5144DRAFT_173817 [Chaetomium globosum]
MHLCLTLWDSQRWLARNQAHFMVNITRVPEVGSHRLVWHQTSTSKNRDNSDPQVPNARCINRSISSNRCHDHPIRPNDSHALLYQTHETTTPSHPPQSQTDAGRRNSTPIFLTLVTDPALGANLVITPALLTSTRIVTIHPGHLLCLAGRVRTRHRDSNHLSCGQGQLKVMNRRQYRGCSLAPAWVGRGSLWFAAGYLIQATLYLKVEVARYTEASVICM